MPLSTVGDTLGPEITSWLINSDETKGSSTDSGIHAVVSQYDANVQQVQYNATDVYVNATGVPSYDVGPWLDGNPAVATDRDWLFQLPLDPSEKTGTKTTTPLGNIGVFVNGVAIYNAQDAQSFNNQGVWYQNAVVFEEDGMDIALGHPSPVQGGGNIGSYVVGQYHHHQRPVSLLSQLGDDSASHSPLVGFAFDGFPVYGPYGYDNSDGTGDVVRIESGYQLRAGLRPPPPMGGPGAAFDGSYIEDHEYLEELGHLDEHNGRFGVTPEYPGGIYHYVATIDATGESAYPYIIGPEYYGVVQTNNLDQSVVVPGDVVIYQVDVPEPSAIALLLGIAFIRRRV
jgi:hypothetical protein